MVGRCFIKNCPTGSRLGGEKVSVFHPPKGELLKWQKLIPRKDKALTHNHFICEKHFQKKLIIRELKSDVFSVCFVELCFILIILLINRFLYKSLGLQKELFQQFLILQLKIQTRMKFTIYVSYIYLFTFTALG